jgi:hypothetical protein
MAQQPEIYAVHIGEPEIAPRSSVDMDEVEFTEKLLDHVTGRRRWPVEVTVPVDIVLWPKPRGV